MTPILYGIPNCDTVRKARRWLADRGVDYRFHDVRKDGLKPQLLRNWAASAGWDTLLNRRGTTWRQLPEATRTAIDAERALQLMLEQPTLIKRPVLELQDHIEVGFSADRYQSLFS